MSKSSATVPPTSVTELADVISSCHRCPRLVAWREQVAKEKRASYRDDTYWGRAVPGFGAADARVLIAGLAPAAHGANRTGRMFTGDRSGDWLYGALYRAGFANQAQSHSRDDGLELINVYVTSLVHCAPPANKPTTQERDQCMGYFHHELDLLPNIQVIIALGSFGWNGVLKALAERGADCRPKPKFGHLAERRVGAYTLLGSYHPSQQNTFTGRLTTEMFDAVFSRANELLTGATPPP